MFANVSCLSILIGMTSAVQTLCSQQNGAGRYKEVGITLQRSILILSFISLPIAVIWFNVTIIFRLFRIEESVCIVMGNFMRVRILCIPIDVIYESYRQYLMAIGVMRPSMWGAVTFNLSLVVFSTLFVCVLKLGYECLAWSWVLSMFLCGLVQIGLSWSHPSVVRTMQPWDWAAWERWDEFVGLGLPGTVMMCSEWWAFEILTMFASLLGTAEVGAQNLVLQTHALAVMIAAGLGLATTSLVGNALGANMKTLAVKIGRLVILSVVVVDLLVGLVLLLYGTNFVNLFTSDSSVLQIADSVVPFLAFSVTIKGIQGVATGLSQ